MESPLSDSTAATCQNYQLPSTGNTSDRHLLSAQTSAGERGRIYVAEDSKRTAITLAQSSAASGRTEEVKSNYKDPSQPHTGLSRRLIELNFFSSVCCRTIW